MRKFVIVLICLTFAYVSADVTECPSYGSVGVLKVGETKPIRGTCTAATCDKDGKIIEIKCPRTLPNSFLCQYIRRDNTELYPYCCPQYSCPVERGIVPDGWRTK